MEIKREAGEMRIKREAGEMRIKREAEEMRIKRESGAETEPHSRKRRHSSLHAEDKEKDRWEEEEQPCCWRCFSCCSCTSR